jgi:aldose 1-epimerase
MPKVDLFTLENTNGMTARLTTYGATLTELLVPDKDDNVANVVLGFENLRDYEKNMPYFGATIGRYANRIAGAEFLLDGKTYQLAKNDGKFNNTLHGGWKGFDKRIWSGKQHTTADGNSVTFSYVSPDMEEGFPGTLKVSVTYTLTSTNELQMEFDAVTDQPTPVNLTNHAYFNLSGSGAGNILDHQLCIKADCYLPINAKMIPTGELKNVEGTAFDFREPTAIGARIATIANRGYDHNYILRPHENNGPRLVAAVRDPKSGRRLQVLTTEPGLQFYSGNWLDEPIPGIGVMHDRYDAFCLEAQHYPDSPHHPQFPNVIYGPGDKYRQVTIYKFLTG